MIDLTGEVPASTATLMLMKNNARGFSSTTYGVMRVRSVVGSLSPLSSAPISIPMSISISISIADIMSISASIGNIDRLQITEVDELTTTLPGNIKNVCIQY